MHIHLSFLHTSTLFMAILIWGTLWRLIAAHLVGKTSADAVTNKIGRAMAFQF
jgi:hypothetical protein